MDEDGYPETLSWSPLSLWYIKGKSIETENCHYLYDILRVNLHREKIDNRFPVSKQEPENEQKGAIVGD